MSVIEANITIDVPDGVNPQDIINMIQRGISQVNNKNTHINVIEVDDPLSLSPITIKKIKE